MLSAVPTNGTAYCHACFSGNYPIPIDAAFHKNLFEDRQLRFFESRSRDDVGT